MIGRSLLRFLVCALALLLLGAAPAIRFTEPAAGSTRTHMPQRVALDFAAAADPLTLQVTLNGVDISSQLTLGPVVGGRREASAEFVWDALQQGANALSASVDLAGSPVNAVRDFFTTGDPYADAVTRYTVGSSGGFNSLSLPGIVLGSPAGEGLFLGSLDVVSLGFGGSIVLEFDDNVIVDHEGVDFTVFENAILAIGAGSITQVPFAEPARVSVSQDGISWLEFPCTLTLQAGPYWPGCAGVYPVIAEGSANQPHASIPTDVPIDQLVGVSVLTIQNPPGAGGNSFDLADIGLPWVRYVRIEAADFATGPFGVDNGAFDLDAVAAVNSAPAVPSLPSLSAPGLLVLALGLIAFGVGSASRRTR